MGYLTPEQQTYILDAIQATPGMAMAVTLTTLVSDSKAAVLPEAVDSAAPSDPYGGVASQPDVAEGDYALQEIYLPEANNAAPLNSAPVFEVAQ